jgi:hypothetical protein
VADHKTDLFKTFFIAGSVWTAVETFSDNSSALKFLVILAEIDSAVFYLRTTSKGRYFKLAKHCSFVEIPQNTCTIFSVETFISCDQLHSKSREDFAQLHSKGKINYKGLMPAEIFQEIKSKLEASKVLSRREKQYLFGK